MKSLLPNKGGTFANNTPVGAAGQPAGNGGGKNLKNAVRRRMDRISGNQRAAKGNP